MIYSVEKRRKLLDSICRWASADDNVRALVQTGSLARKDGFADQFSDLDIEIIARNPACLETEDAWIRTIGDAITIMHLGKDEDQDWTTRLVIYEGGIKTDFTLADLSRLEEMIDEENLDPMYDRGYRILVDKDGTAKRLQQPSFGFPVEDFPSEEHFGERVEEFWFEAFHVPRYLARGELFLVKQRDWTMKVLLLEMMEWHALARSEEPIDVWHMGTRLRSWSDEKTWSEVQNTFGRFDAEDAKRAYDETAQLYGRLAREVARMKSWDYPQVVEDRIRSLESLY